MPMSMSILLFKYVRKTPVLLKPGSEMFATIERIGMLSTHVCAMKPSHVCDTSMQL